MRFRLLAIAAATLAWPAVAWAQGTGQVSGGVADAAPTYDGKQASARAAWQYQGASIADYGDRSATTRGGNHCCAHSRIDASVLYNLTRDIQLQLQGLDLNDAVFGFFSATPSGPYAVQREFYGRTIVAGT